MMKKIYQTLAMAAFLTCMPVMSAKADDEGIARDEERWEMTYRDLQSVLMDNPEFCDLKREVRIRWDYDNGCFYIKGLFRECPDSWAKGFFMTRVAGIYSDQTFTDENGNTVYLNFGTYASCSISEDDRQFSIGVSLKRMSGYPLKFGDDGADKDILLTKEYNHAMWISENNSDTQFTRTYYFDAPPTGNLDDRPVVIAPSFRRIGLSGIGSVMDGESQHTDDALYDLSGRQVNPENLTPGIYIRGGRKFIVR